MAFRFKRKESVLEGVQRMAIEQIEKAIAEIDNPQLIAAERVHLVRKRCKKLRGLLRLVRPGFSETYQRENAWFRDTARALSELRDAKTMQETYDKVTSRYEDQINRRAMGSIRRRLTIERKKMLATEADPERRLAKVAERLNKAQGRVQDWSFSKSERKALFQGIAKTYSRGREAMVAAWKNPSPEAFHEWRKRAKYHWYHARIMQPMWPDLLNAERKVSSRLADLLGDDHDLAVLIAHLTDSPGEFGKKEDVDLFVALANQRRQELQQAAFANGQRLFAENAKQFVARWQRYWQVWHGSKVG